MAGNRRLDPTTYAYDVPLAIYIIPLLEHNPIKFTKVYTGEQSTYSYYLNNKSLLFFLWIIQVFCSIYTGAYLQKIN